ncbi:hypothetical protein D3C87_1838170 [compost metagenome]
MSRRAKMLAMVWKVRERMNSTVPYSASAPIPITSSMVSVSRLWLTMTRSPTCIMKSGTVSRSRFTHRLRKAAYPRPPTKDRCRSRIKASGAGFTAFIHTSGNEDRERRRRRGGA